MRSPKTRNSPDTCLGVLLFSLAIGVAAFGFFGFRFRIIERSIVLLLIALGCIIMAAWALYQFRPR